jgi:mycofactocin precursor
MTVTTEDNPTPSAGATRAPGSTDRVSDTPATAGDRPVGARSEDQVQADLVEEDLLVEDVSIDGMCGVY